MSEVVDEAQNAMTPDEIEFWNKIKHGNCPCGGRLVPHIEHWVADEIDWVKAVGLECENRCGIDLNMTEALTTALEQATEIEQLRRERETLAAAVRGWQRYLERDLGTESVHASTLIAHEAALALLDGEKGGGGA